MSYKLIPRFNYALPFLNYFKISQKLKDSGTLDLFGPNSNIYHFNQARVGLRVLLNSISRKKMNVGVQAYTCHTVFQAIHNSGNNITFIDITDDFKLDLADLKSKLDKLNVLIITHTFGYPDNIDAIRQIAKNVIIIEDCAHSFLAKYNGHYTGTIGDAAIFSTGLAKLPPIGAGGFVLINKLAKFPNLENEYSKLSDPSITQSLKVYLKALLSSVLFKPPFFGMFSYKIGKTLDKKLDVGNKFSFKESKGYDWAIKLLNNNFALFEKMVHSYKNNSNFLSSSISKIINSNLDSMS